MGVERQDNLIQCTGQNLVQLVNGQVDPVVGYSTLRKIIGPDPFTAVAAADLVFTVLRNLIVPFLLKSIKQPGAHHLCGLCFILVLGFFVLAGDDNTSGQVSYPDSRISGIDRLAAWSR